MKHRTAWLIFPCVAYLIVIYVIPTGIMFWTPFEAGFPQGLTEFGEALREPGYQRVTTITFELSVIVTIGCILLGYPTAYFLSRIDAHRARFYLLLVMFPLWTSVLVRTYAWIAVLQDAGIINSVLIQSGLIDEPLKMLYNKVSVSIGMVQILLPYAIITMYAVMVGINGRLLQTAQILGASPSRAFLHVFVPLSLPGLSAATLLVFVMGLGFLVTPALLGGRKETMLAMLIYQQVVLLGDWNSAAILSVLLLVATVILLLIYGRFAKIGNLLSVGA